MKKWLLLLIPALLSAEPITVNSEQVTYSDGTILLRGHVQIVHPLARITAEEARMHHGEGHTFELHDAVKLNFSDGGTLSCAHAFVDPDTLYGRFSGGPVVYSESEASMLSSPIALQCERMDVRTADGAVETLVARGAVQIRHGETLAGRADETHYDRRGQLPPALITRYMLSRAVTEEPETQPSQPVIADVLRLSGNVALDAHKLGKLENDDQVWLVRVLANGQPQIDCISATGETILSSADGGQRCLTCAGNLFIDQARKRAHLSGNPVTYSDPLGGFVADEMTVEYTDAGALRPTLITLVGNVRIRNHALGNQLHLQYALADRVVYRPETETMTLSALDAGRVLFLDSQKDTRVSAHEVVINRHERSVEGVGQVRFSLSQGEISALKEVFELDG